MGTAKGERLWRVRVTILSVAAGGWLDGELAYSGGRLMVVVVRGLDREGGHERKGDKDDEATQDRGMKMIDAVLMYLGVEYVRVIKQN